MISVRQNKAFALVFSLIFLSLIISFVAVYSMAIASGFIMSNRAANEIKAYYTAEAGLADAYERIIQSPQNTTPPQTTVQFIPSASTDNGIYQTGTGQGNYSVSIVATYTPRINYTITSTGTYNNVSKTLQLRMIGRVISTYAYWSQTEVNPQYGDLWWVGEPGLQYYTFGPVQTNGSLNIWGNPIFYGPVTEGGAAPNYQGGTGSDPSKIWLGGLTNSAPLVDLPPQGILNAISLVASNGGLVLTGKSTVLFNPDGTITVTGVVKNTSGTVIKTYNNSTINPPANGAIYVQSNFVNGTSQQDGNVTVQGTVNGQLTVAADQNVYISGSVSYNSDPRINPSSKDLVGLVANQNITIVEASAPAKLELSAVMVALQGSFQVDQYWVYRGDANTAVMDQFGSLINYVCGVTGEIDWSGNLLGGWNQLQSYDNRLLNPGIAPPGFPPYVNNQGYGVYNKISVTECTSGICG